jgi:capsular exopolysaccharide synthesis family protein
MSAKQAIATPGHKALPTLRPIVATDGQSAEATPSSVVAHSESPVAQGGESAAGQTRSTAGRGRKIPAELQSVRWVQRMSRKYDRDTRSAPVRREVRSKPKARAVGSRMSRKGKVSADKPDIVSRGQKVHLESKSVVAEAYRTIRTAIFFGAPKDEARTILVTSPAPGDGKSTLASNLAITMAQAGQKTLIIDADFRKPVQHKIFEVDDDRGLSGVLAGRDTIEQVIRPGPVEGLEIMACGLEVPNPSELLNSDACNETLKALCERYDRIVIDSPPVAPVADSQILAAVCDITLLVVRAEKSTRRQAQHARDSLLSVGARLLGAIVNDVSQKGGQYGYYSSYGYYGNREKKTG